jgi:hypothetical protein
MEICQLTVALLLFSSKTKINFDGGDLSSDSGLFLLKEFIHKINFKNIILKIFKTNNSNAATINVKKQYFQ